MFRTGLSGILALASLATTTSPVLAQSFLPEGVQIEHRAISVQGQIETVYFRSRTDADAAALLAVADQARAPVAPQPAMDTYGRTAMNLDAPAMMRTAEVCMNDGLWEIAISGDGRTGSARRVSGDAGCTAMEAPR